MTWTVEFDDAFAVEFRKLDRDVQVAIHQHAVALGREGPQLKRPHADALEGSRHRNMRELRPTVRTVEWRVAYAFDSFRRAMLLAAAAKGGSKTAYARLIRTADARFDAHLKALKEED